MANNSITLKDAGEEKVILAAVCSGDEQACQESLDELEALAETAGASVTGRLIQKREGVSPATYFGSGKILELYDLMTETGATGVIIDDELSPAQQRNLERELEMKVMDRTLLILDIFALHAQTAEGRIQVELAQLQYRMMRLSGLGTSLSRLGGGIGTRGPGEKKLETDRRLIRKRISRLKAELAQVRSHRDLLREGRSRNAHPVFAIVGYTNAGKSSLLNALTGAGALSENKLFATLDPMTQGMQLPDGQEVLLTDTVGFIRKLPHHLVEAFRSTLEEAKYADVILHVSDAASPQMEQQMFTVYETLEQLGVHGKPVITLLNKTDLLEHPVRIRDMHADRTVSISAKTGEGLDELKNAMQEMLTQGQILIERNYGYQEAGRIALIRRYGKLLEEQYRDDSIYVKAYVPAEIYGRV